MNYVGFWRRFAALFLDGIILGVVNWLVSSVTGINTLNTTAAAAAANPMALLVSLGISIVYWVVLQSYMGQTLGKKVMGIKVVDSAGNKPSMITFALREILGKLISSIILGIGYLMVIWDGKKQALHDKIASTYVVKA